MDRHNRLNIPIKIIIIKNIFQIYRNQTGLPVMTMDNIRMEANCRETGKRCFTKERKLFQIPKTAFISLISGKIVFIIHKIKGYAVQLHLQNTYILVLPSQIHIKMGAVLHLLFKMIRYNAVFGNDHPYIKFVFVKCLRQGTGYVCQAACLYKRYCLR